MIHRPHLLAVALSLGFLSACSPQAPSSLTWAGTEAATAVKERYVFQPFHGEALVKTGQLLSPSHHLVSTPLTDTQVKQIAKDFLASIGQSQWLTAPELEQLQSAQALAQWRKALEGQDTTLVAEVGALVHQRQEAWQAQHGSSSPGPAPGQSLPPGKPWNVALGLWAAAEPTAAPLRLLTPEETVQTWIEVRTRTLDPHTVLVRPAQAQSYNETALRTAHGVGLVLALEQQKVVVQSLIPHAPADVSKQVKIGDELLAIRLSEGPWHPVASTEEAMALLREKSSWFELKLKRKGKPLVVRLEPTSYANNAESMKVTQEILPASNGQKIRALRLEVSFFYEDGEEGKSLGDEIQSVLSQARDTDVVVLDFRRCRGGSLAEALKIAGLFVEGGTLGELRMGDGHRQPLKDPSAGQYWAGPVQLWVGPQTASSAELVAQAIRDRVKGAQVLGWPTYGKGTLQKRIELDMPAVRQEQPSRLGELWYTVAEIYSVSGRSLQQQGVALDGVLPNAVPQPWGEKALIGSLRPHPEATPFEGRTIQSAGGLTPSMADAKGLPLWRKAAAELLINPAPGT